MDQSQRPHRPGDADIEQTTLFINTAFGSRAIVGKETLFQADQVNVFEFDSRRRVQRDQGDAASLFVLFVFLLLLIEGDFIEKTTKPFRRSSQEQAEVAQDIADVRFANGGFLRTLAIAAEIGGVPDFADQAGHDRCRIAQRLGPCCFVTVHQLDEGTNTGGRPLADVSEKLLAPERTPKTAFLLHAEFQGACHCWCADSAGGSVDDTEQTRVVVRVYEQAHVSEQVLYLPPIEEAFSADDPIGDMETAQVLFEQPGLSVHAEQNCERLPRVAVGEILSLHLLDHELGFLLVVRCFDQPHLFATFLGAPELFRAASRIIPDQRTRRPQDRVGASVILLQRHDRRVGKMMFEFQNVRDFRAPPAVDRLVVIANDGDVAMFVGQERDQFQLEFVRVLELIDHEIAKPLPPPVSHIRMLVQQSYRERQEIVEVDRVESLELMLVTGEDSAEKRFLIFRRFPAIVLSLADQAFGDIRIQLFVAGGSAGNDFLDQPKLVAFVVNTEVIFVAEAIDIRPENAKTKRM